MREKITASNSSQFPSSGVYKKRVLAFLLGLYAEETHGQFESSFSHLSLLLGEIFICKMNLMVISNRVVLRSK